MTYFSELYRHNKWLCLGVAVFCALTIAANLLKVEATPVFIWGMYSDKETAPQEYRILKVVVNDSIPINYSAGYPDATRFYLLSPLTYYWSIVENDGKDPEETYYREKLGKYFKLLEPVRKHLFNDSGSTSPFIKWYAGYLEEVTRIPVSRLEVTVLTVAYHGAGRPEIQQKSTLVKWSRP
ncbi:MAG TPA: hypothetical protein VGM24_02060 [Puia sp.]|jgi:hypothetical protein